MSGAVRLWAVRVEQVLWGTGMGDCRIVLHRYGWLQNCAAPVWVTAEFVMVQFVTTGCL